MSLLLEAIERPLLQEAAEEAVEDEPAIARHAGSWRVTARRTLPSFCLVGLLGAQLQLRRSSEPLPPTAALLAAEEGVCPPTSVGAGELPWLDIVGGPTPPRRGRQWIPRMCVPEYEGPNCWNGTQWHGKVTLCLNGQAIADVNMQTRGHVSIMFPKHQFELSLPRSMGLLGMAPANEWVLGTSWIDTSFQRNPLAFDLYRSLGGWAPATRYVNVRWHGADYGLYYVGEQPEVSKSRIQLPEDSTKDPAESSFLVTADWQKAGRVSFETPNTSTFFSVIWPKGVAQVSPAQHAFLEHLFDEVDRRALAVPGPDTQDGLEEILDFPSFARYYIVQEMAKDVDGYAFSNYMSVQAGRLFHAAPWDFDLAFHFDCTPVYYTNLFTGEVNTGPTGWNVENPRTMGYWTANDGWGNGTMEFGSNKRQLFLNIWRHPRFAAAFVAAWRAARQGPLSDTALQFLVRRRGAQVAAAARRDIGIWRESHRCGFWPCCHAEDAVDFSAATRHLEGYLLDRARWIDARAGGLLAR